MYLNLFENCFESITKIAKEHYHEITDCKKGDRYYIHTQAELFITLNHSTCKILHFF